ncbi:MAG TPA: hypothetical protein VEZ90_08200, partial [Blastocatellia bacterium]|nr:hypothetical protein [Blastocatellia bacterium]
NKAKAEVNFKAGVPSSVAIGVTGKEVEAIGRVIEGAALAFLQQVEATEVTGRVIGEAALAFPRQAETVSGADRVIAAGETSAATITSDETEIVAGSGTTITIVGSISDRGTMVEVTATTADRPTTGTGRGTAATPMTITAVDTATAVGKPGGTTMDWTGAGKTPGPEGIRTQTIRSISGTATKLIEPVSPEATAKATTTDVTELTRLS